MFEELLQEWDGEEAVIRYDAESGAWMFVCIHSTACGPAGGGTRLRVYPTPADGLADAMRLSGAMTRKMALAGMPLGGGKAVLAVPELPEGEARRRLLLRYGRLVESLGGTFRTAGDMNITPADLDVVSETCQWVLGSTGRGGDSGRGTARGVLHGIEASVEHIFGSPDLDGRSVLVADVDEERAGRVATEIGGELIPVQDALTTECDVYAPCAIGGTLSAATIPTLGCRIVAGSANNQLVEPEDAARLHAAAILYAPDYVINAGGVLQLAGLENLGWDEAELERSLAGIGDTLRGLYRDADANGITPAEAAERLAAARVAAALSSK